MTHPLSPHTAAPKQHGKPQAGERTLGVSLLSPGRPWMSLQKLFPGNRGVETDEKGATLV